MIRIALITLALLGGIVNVQADGYPYSNVRKGNSGFRLFLRCRHRFLR